MFCCYMYCSNESVFLNTLSNCHCACPPPTGWVWFGILLLLSGLGIHKMFTQASSIRKPCMSTNGRLHQEAISKIIWPPSSFSSSHFTQFSSSCFNALHPRIPFIHHPLILRQRHLTLPDLAPYSSRTGPTAKPIGHFQGHYLLQ